MQPLNIRRLGGAAFILLVAFVVHLQIGQMALSWSALLNSSSLTHQVFFELRLPRALAAILVGASLGASGSILQTVLHNPLAEPGLLGISSGASLAAVLAMVLSALLGWALPIWMITLAAFIGALVIALLLFSMAKRYQFGSATLLLFGVVIGIIAGAGITWCLYFSPEQNLRQLLYWLMGSLSFAHGQVYHLSPLFLSVFVLLIYDSRYLNWLLLGDRYAFSLGVDIHKVRPRLILWVSLLSAISVACAGTISFIGLLVPHVIRRIYGDEQRQLLWLSAILGAAVVLIADALALTIIPGQELPIGVITATIGGPILFFLLLRHPYD
ncbi:iron chelate uptake ABC transporter family permease subunit [Celerinatantimonas diazotrophica]|uniref:Vitamin B12 transport system permease protein n=1 Tax=Celerinatantimonas diazotrophica TaxID=412034 RepID=A0A4R1JLA4_9GAMM|nr:iron chelate uptake ABC transporter family permease subunit [Celerinatantimonas diazotrophica]TCK51806.1 vitamin B12 transport system permease protein [Celerinatantimonas diazotrophica]CAG9296502.1 Hemin transport system permease protein HmuU [Celerinatantimonas diazotrophica]